MKNRAGVLAVGIIGLIVIAFTVTAFFLLEIERVPVNWFAFAFLLLSEVAFFGGLIGLRLAGAKHSRVFLRAGVSTALSMYFGATLVSVLFAGMFSERLYTFILIQIAIVVLFSIITIAIIAWSRSIARQNEADMAKVGTNEPKRGGF